MVKIDRQSSPMFECLCIEFVCRKLVHREGQGALWFNQSCNGHGQKRKHHHVVIKQSELDIGLGYDESDPKPNELWFLHWFWWISDWVLNFRTSDC